MMMHKAHVLGKVGHMLPTMAANFPEIATKVNTLFILIISVADPVHFDTAPDPRIRFTEKRIRIRPKIEKILTFSMPIFLLIAQEMIYYYIDLKILIQKKKKILNDFFYVFTLNY